MTVDRIDSAKGYTKDNIQSLCAVCNRLKFTMSNKDFYCHLKKIIKNQNKLAGESVRRKLKEHKESSYNAKKVKKEHPTLFSL